MQCIYKITFPNGKFYIGQTTNFKQRMANHQQSKGSGSPLLEFEWGNADPESIEVLCACKTQDELNLKEVQYIEALKPPLNTLKGGEACQGINHPRAKHDEDTYKEVLRLYIETDASYKDISDITEVDYHTVRDVVLRRTHTWLDQHYDPKLLKAAYECRHPKIVLYDRNNTRYEAETQKELAGMMGVQASIVSSALSKDAKYSLNGIVKEPHEQITLVSPDGETFETNVFLAKILIEEAGLQKYQKIQLLTKKKPSGGWKVKKI